MKTHFALALLLPVLSALGFVTMARDLARNAVAEQRDLATPLSQEARETRDRMNVGSMDCCGAMPGSSVLRLRARGAHRRRASSARTCDDHLSEPQVTVPRGWSVLDASRAFHIPHASSCGGRARCSTCRVRVNSGADSCPEPSAIESATLERIAAEPDVRLACQLRPYDDITVTPLVFADRPVYRAQPSALESEREVVLFYCDFANSSALARDHMAHDVLFAFKRYAESACRAIRSAGGTICYVDHDNIFALFGLSGSLDRASPRRSGGNCRH